MRILVDMDEVLADFVGGCCRAFGVSRAAVESKWTPGEYSVVPPLGRVLGRPDFGDEHLWAQIHSAGEGFWADLAPTPWCLDMVELAKSLAPDDWWVVTAPSRCPSSVYGKALWMKRYFGREWYRLVPTRHKHLLAGPGVVLIDDCESNCEAFDKGGGRSVLFPHLANRRHVMHRDPMPAVRSALA